MLMSSLSLTPQIAAVPAGAARPLWSVMIPTFNCAGYLATTLRSVLAQDPGRETMQIEVLDNCSTDDPAACVKAIGAGRVAFHRHPTNTGMVANFNSCLQRARGNLVHILHGDDWVAPEFYRTMAAAAEHNPDVALFACRAFVVDENGEISDLSWRYPGLERPTRDSSPLWYDNAIFTPSVVVRRTFYESHGGFLPALKHAPDWEMWVRGIGLGGGLMLNRPLAYYRMSATNDTSTLQRTAGNLRDCLLLGTMFEHLPGFSAPAFRKRIAERSRFQATFFRLRGDREAYRANLDLWKSLVPPWSRVMLLARELLKIPREHRHLWK